MDTWTDPNDTVLFNTSASACGGHRTLCQSSANGQQWLF
jgi:hypothetical protein